MSKTEEPEFVLLPEVADKFKVVNTKMPTLHSRIGFVDFRTMDLEQAEALIAAGTDYLEKITTKKADK